LQNDQKAQLFGRANGGGWSLFAHSDALGPPPSLTFAFDSDGAFTREVKIMDWFSEADEPLAQWKTRERATRTFRSTFTAQAWRALDAALSEARKLSFNAIGAEHLLLGLLQQSEGIAPRVLAASGLSTKLVRTEVERAQGQLSAKWVPERLPFTPRMKCVLRTARREAEAQGRSLVGDEQLLLGLLGEEEGLPAALFRKLGINTCVLRNRLLEESACT
jgi:hypothetical protein